MKRKLMKSMIAAGAVAMICACGDDSASSNPATPIADNACAKAVVMADAWLLNNWVIYADDPPPCLLLLNMQRSLHSQCCLRG